jgi:dipeptidyl-peptidase-3
MRKILFSLLILLLVLSLFSGCGKKEEKREYLLEKVGDVAIVQLYADGFEKLPKDEKILAYWLYQASLAGRDIAYDQANRYELEIRNLLEEIVTHSAGISKELLDKIVKYLKLFWVHNGNYDSDTAKKFVPEFSFPDLLSVASSAFKNGANFDVSDEKELESKLKRLEKPIFDINFQPYLVNKSPQGEKDIITGSANNFYEGVSLVEVENFPEKYPLNSKVTKVNGKIVELVYKAGTEKEKPGLYAKQLSRVIFGVEKALPYAKDKQKKALGYLIQYFKTGDPSFFEKYNISWVGDDPEVETILGFIETYMDARGAKGEYEGIVSFVDKKTTKLMKDIATNASHFEEKAPWEEKYKKKEFALPVANSVNVLIGVGDGGPLVNYGIDLPNAQYIREKYGSKNFLLTNEIDADRKSSEKASVEEFGYSDEEKELDKKYGEEAGILATALHEIIGHGSGKVSPDLKKDPGDYLKEYYSTLEEARADLCALWHIWDDKLLKLGCMSNKKCAEAEYYNYVRGDLTMLRSVLTGDKLEEDHMRGHHMIVSYLREKKKVVDVIEKDGKVYFKINDLKKMKEGIGELLSEIMRIKAEGDYQAIKNLVDTYGIKINTQWRDQVVRRAKSIDLPNYTALVMPKLVPVEDANGNIIDVNITYPKDFMEQQLEFSGRR